MIYLLVFDSWNMAVWIASEPLHHHLHDEMVGQDQLEETVTSKTLCDHHHQECRSSSWCVCTYLLWHQKFVCTLTQEQIEHSCCLNSQVLCTSGFQRGEKSDRHLTLTDSLLLSTNCQKVGIPSHTNQDATINTKNTSLQLSSYHPHHNHGEHNILEQYRGQPS